MDREMHHDRPSQPPAKPLRQTLPPGTHALGMWLFLITLSILFFAGILAYAIIRIGGTYTKTHPVTQETIAPTAPPLHTLHTPTTLWLSTLAILASSFTIHRAYKHLHNQQQARFQRAMLATLLLALPFFVGQGIGLNTLWAQASAGGIALQNAVIFLVFLHLLHVVAGLVPLALTTKHAYAGRYSHEHATPVQLLAMYWHFLDLAWLGLFATFVALG